jgi:hypothetical protein
MAKKQRKIAPREKSERNLRKQNFMTIFIRGKMKRVPKPQQIEGMDVDAFVLRNGDPICLHRNELWEYMECENGPCDSDLLSTDCASDEAVS